MTNSCKLSILQRAVHYLENGTGGLLIGLGFKFSSTTVGESIVLDLGSIGTSKKFIFDYRVNSIEHYKIEPNLSEEEFFQLSLVREVLLTYQEYELLCKIGTYLRDY